MVENTTVSIPPTITVNAIAGNSICGSDADQMNRKIEDPRYPTDATSTMQMVNMILIVRSLLEMLVIAASSPGSQLRPELVFPAWVPIPC